MKIVTIHVLSLAAIKNKREFLLSFVDEEREKKSLSYKREENQLQSLGAGYFLKKYTDSKKPFSYNEFHKPYKEGEYFNLSHSNDCVVFLKADKECGIDIEKITEFKSKLVPYAFSLEEQKKINNKTDFFAFWTRKEALGKANGTGLNDDSIKKIPSSEGIQEYKGKVFTIKTMYYKNYVLSIALSGSYDDLATELQEERID